MPPEAAPLAADPVMVAGFLVFWAELGEIIRKISTSERRGHALIINLILANRSLLCALVYFAVKILTAKAAKASARFAKEPRQASSSPLSCWRCLLTHFQKARRGFWLMPTIRFGKITSTLNAPSPTSSRF